MSDTNEMAVDAAEVGQGEGGHDQADGTGGFFGSRGNRYFY